MHPILIQFKLFGKEITFGTYGVMALIGISSAILIAYFLSRRFRYDTDDVVNYAILTAVGGVVGAFIVGFLLFLPERISYGFFSYPPALVSWGGIIGGIVAIVVLKIRWSLNLLNFADIIAPGFFVGLGFGRIGCHFGGCCYGITTNCSIGVTFTHHIAPASHMPQPLLPVQLISAATLITIGMVMIPFAMRRKTPGSFLSAMLIIYPLFRFTIEFFRADPRFFLFGLSDGQLFSIASFVAGITLALYVYWDRLQLREKLLLLHDPKPEDKG